jgi:hypothetical protein
MLEHDRAGLLPPRPRRSSGATAARGRGAGGARGGRPHSQPIQPIHFHCPRSLSFWQRRHTRNWTPAFSVFTHLWPNGGVNRQRT